jgi:hypothetical protein
MESRIHRRTTRHRRPTRQQFGNLRSSRLTRGPRRTAMRRTRSDDALLHSPTEQED